MYKTILSVTNIHTYLTEMPFVGDGFTSSPTAANKTRTINFPAAEHRVFVTLEFTSYVGSTTKNDDTVSNSCV